jgi:5-methylcytosine-specific restriction endonuclease McrA
VKGADVVDHIVPHKMDKALFWDRSNWQPLCKWHHDVVKQSLELSYANRRIGADALKANSPVFKNETLKRGGV